MTLEIIAKAVAKALWHNEPDRPFTDAAWERELKWWRDAKEDGRIHPLGDVSHNMFADRCFRVARAALLALSDADLHEAITSVACNNPTVLSPTGRACVQAEAAFRALLRALAKEEGQ